MLIFLCVVGLMFALAFALLRAIDQALIALILTGAIFTSVLFIADNIRDKAPEKSRRILYNRYTGKPEATEIEVSMPKWLSPFSWYRREAIKE